MSVKRNDPCPCASGKKYKACCLKADKARQMASRSNREATEVITPQTIPYFFFKKWNEARSRGEYALLFDLCYTEGPFRSQFKDLDAFLAHAQQHPLPSGPDWFLEKIKLDDHNAYLLASRGRRDLTTRQLGLEMIQLRRTEHGWRVHDVKRTRIAKPDDKSPTQISFGNFGLASANQNFLQRVAEGFERPDLADENSILIDGEPLEKETAESDATDTGSQTDDTAQPNDTAQPDTAAAPNRASNDAERTDSATPSAPESTDTATDSTPQDESTTPEPPATHSDDPASKAGAP